MATNDVPPALERAPDWWAESALGLGVVLGATLAVLGGSLAVATGVAALDGSSPELYGSVAGTVATVVLVATLHATVCVGATYVYLTRRGFDRGFVFEDPDRATVRWLAGLVVLAVAVVWGGTLLATLRSGVGPGAVLSVPAAFVGSAEAIPTGARGVHSAVFLPLGLVLFAGVVGPALGTLFHGVLQNSLRQVVPVPVAVAGTALALSVAAGSWSDPLGVALVVLFGAAAGYGYERTGNLLVPALSYAALNAVAVTTGALFLLSSAGGL